MNSDFFEMQKSGTSFATECISGIVTFMTMAYIIFVNPGILSAAGVPKDAAMVATCLAAGVTTLIMGLLTNYPLALAPGMGLNAFLTYGVVLGMGVPWQTAMGLVFLEGVIILVLVLTNVREWVMYAIPLNLKRAIGVGIGVFITFIGLQSAGMVVKNPATLVSFGGFSKNVTVAVTGLAIMVLLMTRKVRGAILIGIVATTAISMVTGITDMPAVFVAMPKPEQLSTIGAALAPEYLVRVLDLGLLVVLFSLLLTDFFDTMGTVVAVGAAAGYIDERGKIPKLKQVLFVDSVAASIGGIFGCSSVTTYIESASGVSEGGRTGLTSVVTAALFFLSVFLWPLVGVIPAVATAPALIIVGYFMMEIIRDICWDDMTEAFPAFMTVVMIPFTYSISRGIGYGFISYVLIKLFAGRSDEVNPLMYLISAVFVIDFIFAR